MLPVGCLRGEQSAGYFGIHGAIYPTFSDAKTLQRFRGVCDRSTARAPADAN